MVRVFEVLITSISKEKFSYINLVKCGAGKSERFPAGIYIVYNVLLTALYMITHEFSNS